MHKRNHLNQNLIQYIMSFNIQLLNIMQNDCMLLTQQWRETDCTHLEEIPCMAFICVSLMRCWPEGFMSCCLSIVRQAAFYTRVNFLCGFLLPGVSWWNTFYLPAYKTAISWSIWPAFFIVKVVCCFVAMQFQNCMYFLQYKSGIFIMFRLSRIRWVCYFYMQIIYYIYVY